MSTKTQEPDDVTEEGWDQADAILRVRDWNKREAEKWPKKYRPVMAAQLRSVAKIIEVLSEHRPIPETAHHQLDAADFLEACDQTVLTTLSTGQYRRQPVE